MDTTRQIQIMVVKADMAICRIIRLATMGSIILGAVIIFALLLRLIKRISDKGDC